MDYVAFLTLNTNSVKTYLFINIDRIGEPVKP